MAQTTKTQSQLYAELPDNTTRLIHPMDARDIVASCFPYTGGTVPGPNNDMIDSAGIGAFFDTGNTWFHVSAGDLYYCQIGTPGAAQWVHIASGVNAPLTLQPPTDGDFALALEQHSPTQSGNMLQFEDYTGTPGAATINAKGEFSNPGPVGLTGTENERFGAFAGGSLTVGGANTFAGWKSGQAMLTGSSNSAFGTQSLLINFNGSLNTALGAGSMGNAPSGDSNTAAGCDSLAQTSGSGNTAVGTHNNNYPNSHNGNVSIGYGCGSFFISGDNNTLVGTITGQSGMGDRCTMIGYNVQQDGGGPYSDSSGLGANAVITASHQIMMGTAAEQVVHSGFSFWATSPSGAAFVPASYAVLNGTPLFGLSPIGPIVPTPTDRVLAWDGASATTWGVYHPAAGAWTRVVDMPAGNVYIGPAYVWVADEAFLLAGMGSLIALEPLSGPSFGNPPTWVLGTDSPDWFYAVPTAKVQNGTFITLTITSIYHGQFDYTVNYTGPLSLNDWAVYGGDLDPTLIDWTTWPPAADVPASNVGPGYPYSDLAGAPATLNTFAQVFNPFSYGTSPTTVFTFTSGTSIQGTISAENLSGSSTARLYVTTVDPRNGTQTNFIGIGSPGNWSGILQIPEQLASLGITPGNLTSITVAVSGNGSTGTAKVTGALIGL